MDFKKIKAENTTVPRDLNDLQEQTGNVYETVMILAKRSNQIASEMKEELNQKLQEFASYSDNLEEVFENREQIEISRFYEKQPKPSLVALHEWMDGNIYHRLPEKDKNAQE